MSGPDATSEPGEPGDRAETVPRGYADVVVGGQAGSEGKGALVAHLVRVQDYRAAVRPGGSNAGHTVYAPDGTEYVHQVLPSAVTVDPAVDCYMAPESSFGVDEFLEEYADAVDRWGESRVSVGVDPKAAVIERVHREAEADRRLGEEIGSTVHGCGAVRVEKIWRSAGDVRLAEDHDALARFLVGDPDAPDRVPRLLADHGRRDEAVVVEGTQGTLLSMNQSPHWPYSTSRDCTASAFLSSCGLPPSAVREVWAVFRTYPIRVGGHSGPMDGAELDFETIADRAGHDEPPVEFTSVTGKKRRVFEWSWEQFDFALRLNDPDYVALTFLDYLDADDHGVRTWWGLSRETREWVRRVDERARRADARVAVLKTGPRPAHVVDLRTRPSSGGRPSLEAFPPVDPADLPADHPVAGPDEEWADRHPTPAGDRPASGPTG